MQLQANEVVPTLRNGLQFLGTPHGLGTDLCTVRHLGSGQVTELRGFEYSLARMLDGRRTARELLKIAHCVGLPITLADLSAFVTKLEALDLIEWETDPAPGGPFQPRERWDEGTRKLFRTALRIGRAGQPELAVSTLDVLLADAPNVAEAHNLRFLLQQQLNSAETRLPFTTVFAQVGRNWRLEADTLEFRRSSAQPAAGRRREFLAATASLAVALLILAAFVF